MSPSLNMPVPPEGYCTRQYSASSRVQIVASDHDLGLFRTITRVPSGHLLSGSGAPDAGTLEACRSCGGAGDNAVLFVDQHRVGEAKFADRGGDLLDLLVRNACN